jgi:hypothetical protein
LVQRSEALDFVTSLPLTQAPGAPAAEAARGETMHEPAGRQPTHLLRDALASPLSAAGTQLENGWELFYKDNGWHLRGAGVQLTVNGSAYTSGQVLVAGDEIGLGAGRSALLIAVEG